MAYDSNPVRVLIVEDNFLVGEMIKGALEETGYSVLGEATTGTEAVEKARELQPDVILMDIQLPEMDGLEAAGRIQKIRPVPVVILSAFENPDLVDQAGKAGVGAYLTKPSTPQEIDRAIRISMSRFNDMIAMRKLISRLKRVEKKLKGLLEEKELLLKEVHHRVKNNFQIIYSLLNLQIRGVSDPQARAVFRESQNRIRLMSLIHEKLYQSENLAHIRFGDYVRSLVQELVQVYGVDPNRVRLLLKLEDIELGIDRAIPCGLIVNELISNSLKYAFPASRGNSGEIEISLKRMKSGDVKLIVKDNGIGLPEDLDVTRTDSLGLHLVHVLVVDQLQGELSLVRERGTEFILRFPG